MKQIIKSILIAEALLVFTMLPALPVSAPNGNKLGFEKEKPSLKEFGAAVELKARSALALDLLTGEILFEKNPHEPLPLASLSKIISSLVIADHINLNQYIEVSKNAVETPEPSTLRPGEHLRAEDLLAMAIGESSNDAMTALVEHLGDEQWFVELMREKVKGLGARGEGQELSFVFQNPTGLDIKLSLGQPLTQTKFGAFEIASNFGSAYDLAQIIKNSLDSIIWQIGNKEEVVSKEGIAHKIKHTNALSAEISGIYGAKTGFTDIAGGNLVLIIERPLGKPKLIVILGSTLEGRFEDAKKLIKLF